MGEALNPISPILFPQQFCQAKVIKKRVFKHLTHFWDVTYSNNMIYMHMYISMFVVIRHLLDI